jgi:hypothetical protein
MSGAPKKRGTRIEPFRHRVETDPKFFDKSWRKLQDAIREIYNHNACGLSFEELYRLNIARDFPPLLFAAPVPLDSVPPIRVVSMIADIRLMNYMEAVDCGADCRFPNFVILSVILSWVCLYSYGMTV